MIEIRTLVSLHLKSMTFANGGSSLKISTIKTVISSMGERIGELDRRQQRIIIIISSKSPCRDNPSLAWRSKTNWHMLQYNYVTSDVLIYTLFADNKRCHQLLLTTFKSNRFKGRPEGFLRKLDARSNSLRRGRHRPTMRDNTWISSRRS